MVFVEEVVAEERPPHEATNAGATDEENGGHEERAARRHVGSADGGEGWERQQLEGMSVRGLRKRLRQHNLPTHGGREQLIERLLSTVP